MKVVLLLAWFVGACGSSDDKPGAANRAAVTPKPPATDPACAAKLKDLEPWLAQLGIEVASHEVDFGGTLVTIDRAAAPIPRHSDWIGIAERVMAYDATVRSIVGTDEPLQRTAPAITERLKQMHATTPPPDERDTTPARQLRVNVDEQTPWKDVVLVADAAANAGYTEALFAFTAKSRMTAPPGAAEVTTSADAESQASRALEALREKCKPWERAVLDHDYNPDRAENAKAVARETTAALAECNCAADPDEVKRLTWQVERWHQAKPRTRVIVKLASGGTTLALRAKTPWSEAHAALLEAAPEGAPPPALRFETSR